MTCLGYGKYVAGSNIEPILYLMTKHKTSERRGAPAKIMVATVFLLRVLRQQQIYGTAMLYEYVERVVYLGSAIANVYIMELGCSRTYQNLCACVVGYGLHKQSYTVFDNSLRVQEVMVTSSKWNHFPRYWSFVRGIHRSPVNSTHKGEWRGVWCFLWSPSE